MNSKQSSRYQLTIGATMVSLATLGDVLSRLNAWRALDMIAPAGERSLETVAVLRDEQPMKVVHSEGHFGVQQHGLARDVFLSMLDEVDKEYVRPDGIVRAPHEMRRCEWDAVSKVGSASYHVTPCFTPEQRAESFPGTLDPIFGELRSDLSDVCEAEFFARFGYGHNGPLYDGLQTNCRHEVHVEYALIYGKHVPEHVLAEYREGYARKCVDDERCFQLVVDIPELRGSLSISQLYGLSLATRNDVPLSSENIQRFLRVVKALATDVSSIEVDDALFAQGLVPAFAAPVTKSAVDTSLLTTDLAKKFHAALASENYNRMVAKARDERDKMQITQRHFDHDLAIAQMARDVYPTGWAVEMSNAMEARDVTRLLSTLDRADGDNETSKQIFAEVFGVKLRGLNSEKRRAAIFGFCGFDTERRNAYEVASSAANAERIRQADAKRATDSAESVRYRLTDGTIGSGREYVDRAVVAGFDHVFKLRRGKHAWWLLNRTTGQMTTVAAKDGTLDYARIALQLPEYKQSLQAAA